MSCFKNYFDVLKVDLEFGENSEREVLPTLREYFNDESIEKTQDKYCLYDFSGKDKRIELKTRKNTRQKYPSTIVGLNKIKNAEKYKGDYYFAFKFTDGLYCIKYDKDLFDTFETRESGRNDRGIIEKSQYVFIPVEILTEI